MWTEKQKNGKYRFIDRYTDIRTGKKRRVSVTLNDNSSQSQRMAAQMLEEKIRVAQLDISRMPEITLRELVDKYIEYQQRTVKASTALRNKNYCKVMLRYLGEDTIVSTLSAKYIKNKMINSGRKNSTLNEDRIRLFAVLHWGYENDYVEDVAYLKKIKPFKENIRHKDKIQDKFLEQEELLELIDNIYLEHWKNMTQLLALSGLRFGEAAALTEDDIDFENRVIIVDKNYDYANDITTTPKTASSMREVYMQDELYKLCKKISVNNKFKKRVNHFDTNLFIFNPCEGTHVTVYAFNKALKKAEKTLSFGKHITAHVLRHTHTSLLAERGMHIDAIARRLGHENSRITKEIYLHITDRQKERERSQLDDIRLLS